MDDRVLLVTGASRGLGAATARLAAASGFKVALVARKAESVTPLAAELGEDRALALGADVGDWPSIAAAVDETVARFGRLDAAFANAGIAVGTSFFGDDDDPDPRAWEPMVRTNVLGAAYTARAALPALRESAGHLLLTGSVAGRYIRNASLYSVTKWAVTGMAGAIREEAVGTGVRVTLINPGITDTDILTDEQRTKPMLTADDIARAVLYALQQPPSVDVNEIMVRPTGQVL
ncbi:short-chain dehydrogenase/reductase [Amycolatopsis mediterranei S699]|uniref:Short-chain dehydrogenase/reductase n=2 Tax=Amycolatopsis mediterranei TaxID=33910 RepID=A0A0H3DAS8_AMYMU|nr:SDR family oxidoreductase [Amycolatopsis mediterranei]ADJ46654.1 short-chain dehydrogenase/reductase [Amycolatopsis mediterranei U32]AEK43454.1 short-chain dehydrogenase/reductase [Amycolatopsis mediterranei S699]AFO78366.1 short-chain dehydrogenase/reductase [Amycolatopsis mediterranei S699]AGT85494.1 short-chain dehydrogenase/reductase [Amycolatopsis mediterranei RB]KDO11444.1 short-chain dehydrogenase [Amycolatopsis mediterranei]